MKKAYLFTSILMVLSMLMAVAPAQAATPEPFSIRKDCHTGTCYIISASPFTELVGAWIEYGTPNFTNPALITIQSSSITIHASDGDTLSGRVAWVLHDGVFQGNFTFQSGTGDLEDVHAQGTITALGGWVFDLTGDYFVAP